MKNKWKKCMMAAAMAAVLCMAVGCGSRNDRTDNRNGATTTEENRVNENKGTNNYADDVKNGPGAKHETGADNTNGTTDGTGVTDNTNGTTNGTGVNNGVTDHTNGTTDGTGMNNGVTDNTNGTATTHENVNGATNGDGRRVDENGNVIENLGEGVGEGIKDIGEGIGQGVEDLTGNRNNR